MKRFMLLLSILAIIGVASLSAKPFMGVFTSTLDDDDYEDLGVKGYYGILIDEVIDDTPADKAGFEDGDVLLEMEGDKVYTSDQLTKMLSTMDPGKKVKCKVMRDKKEMTLKLEVGERSDYTAKKPFIGINMSDLKASTLEKKGVTEGYGILLTGIVDDSAAEKAGLEKGDVLLKIDDDKIYTIGQLGKIVDKMKVGQKSKFLVFRDGDRKTIDVTIGEKELGFSRTNQWFNNIPKSIKIFQDMDKHPNAIGISLNKTYDKQKDGSDKTKVTITRVENNSPADDVGLKEDDEIVSIDGKKISEIDDVFDVIDDKKEGDEIEIKVLRDGKEKIFEPKLKKREDIYENNIQIFYDDGEMVIERNGETIEVDDEIYLKSMQGLKGLKSLENLDNLNELNKLQYLEGLDDIDIDFDLDFADSGEI